MPVSLLALSYRVPKYFKLSIDSIIKTCSNLEDVEITVAENSSICGEEIANYAKQLVDEGKIKRFVRFKENCLIRAFNWMYENYPPQGQFFMMTELDLIVPDGCDWLNETKAMQEQAVLTGYRLNMTNYKHPNRGHQDLPNVFGIWMAGLRTSVFEQEYKKLKQFNIPISDNWMRQAMNFHGKTKSSDEHRLYHLAWDLPFDSELNDYWDSKEKGVNWKLARQAVVDYIYEKTN